MAVTILKYWNRLSLIGIDEFSSDLNTRCVILNNRLNLALAFLLVILNVITTYYLFTLDQKYTFYTSRLLILLIIILANLYLSYLKLHNLSKLSLSIIPVFIIIILPTFLGYVQDSSFYYYHIIIIGFSLVPPLVLIPKEDFNLYIFTIFYFFLLIFFIDDLLIFFASSAKKSIEMIAYFKIYYKIIPVFIFIFLQLGLFYMRNINAFFESELINKNKDLINTIEELKHTQHHLVHSEKMASIGTLVSGVAHELNNPVNILSGGLRVINNSIEEILLNSAFKDQEVLDELNLILSDSNHSIGRINNLIKNLMYASYPSDKLVDIDIREVLDNALLVFNSNTDSYRLITDFKKVTICCYPSRIQYVITAILENAAYYVALSEKEDKIIKIKIDSIGNDLSIKISNNGPEIPKSHFTKIYDPFFSTKNSGDGTGLGLYFAFSAIKEHKGEITAYNEDGWVVFSMRIPIR